MSSSRWLPILAALALVAVVVGITLWGNPEGPDAGSGRASLESLVERHMQPVLDSPEFQQRVQGMSAEQAQGYGMQLAAQGLARIDGPSLVLRARLMGIALGEADVATCAAITRGSAQPAQLQQALLSIGGERLEAWAEVSAKAMLAQLEQTPVVEVGREEAQAAVHDLAQRIPPADGERLRATIRDAASASDADLCFMGRTLHAGVDQLEAPASEVLARALVSR